MIKTRHYLVVACFFYIIYDIIIELKIGLMLVDIKCEINIKEVYYE